jgi:hypothetical protein
MVSAWYLQARCGWTSRDALHRSSTTSIWPRRCPQVVGLGQQEEKSLEGGSVWKRTCPGPEGRCEASERSGDWSSKIERGGTRRRGTTGLGGNLWRAGHARVGLRQNRARGEGRGRGAAQWRVVGIRGKPSFARGRCPNTSRSPTGAEPKA